MVVALAVLPYTLCGRKCGPAALACFPGSSVAGRRKRAEHRSLTSWGRAHRALLHPAPPWMAPLPSAGCEDPLLDPVPGLPSI